MYSMLTEFARNMPAQGASVNRFCRKTAPVVLIAVNENDKHVMWRWCLLTRPDLDPYVASRSCVPCILLVQWTDHISCSMSWRVFPYDFRALIPKADI
ncbi:hypothetical protein AUP41_21795 [Thalassospira xiamenensis]|nr:hypothetical protein AUP41_21795 [Thalassospira xiamenensis]